MQDFESLKNIWEGAGKAVHASNERPMPENLHVRNQRRKLEKEQFNASILLFFTFLVILSMGLFAKMDIKWMMTWVAMYLLSLVCLAQSILLYLNWKKLRRIDETAPPIKHLQQWEAYYRFRKQQLRWNGPAYFIALNVVMGTYFVEIFQGRPYRNVAIFLAVYIAWMLFAYFYIGRKKLRKEDNYLKGIIQDLRAMEEQLK